MRSVSPCETATVTVLDNAPCRGRYHGNHPPMSGKGPSRLSPRDPRDYLHEGNCNCARPSRASVDPQRELLRSCASSCLLSSIPLVPYRHRTNSPATANATLFRTAGINARRLVLNLHTSLRRLGSYLKWNLNFIGEFSEKMSLKCP